MKGGTCDSGDRAGLTCDANGTVANRPVFGRPSLDCPSREVAFRGISPLGGLTAAAPVTKTLTAANPNPAEDRRESLRSR